MFVEHLQELFDPSEPVISGRAVVKEQDSAIYPKEHLMFPSGEELPRCWLEVNTTLWPDSLNATGSVSKPNHEN